MKFSIILVKIKYLDIKSIFSAFSYNTTKTGARFSSFNELESECFIPNVGNIRYRVQT